MGALAPSLGTATSVVVEGDVAGNAGLQLGQVGEAVAVEVLMLEDGPEALGTGVVNRQLPVAPMERTSPKRSQKAISRARATRPCRGQRTCRPSLRPGACR
jgi:hypothetical protein